MPRFPEQSHGRVETPAGVQKQRRTRGEVWGGGGSQIVAKSTNLKEAAARIFPSSPRGQRCTSSPFLRLSPLPFSAAPLQRVPALAEFKSGGGVGGGGGGGGEGA